VLTNPANAYRAHANNLAPGHQYGFNIIKYVWDYRGRLNNSQACIDTLHNLSDTQKLRALYPNLKKEFLSREFLLILNSVRPFARNPDQWPKDVEMPLVTKDSIVYIDPISRVQSESITYGYLTDFSIFMLHKLKKLDYEDSHKEVLNMIGIKPICGIFSYAQLPKNYKFLLGVTGTLKCMTPDQVCKHLFCIKHACHLGLPTFALK
jgi:hypothetical protein